MHNFGENDIHVKLAHLMSDSRDPMLNHTIEGIILSNIINYSLDAIFSTTLDGNITSWNKGAERLYGYRREEVIGQNVGIIFPDNRHNEEPEIIHQIKAGRHVEHYDTIRRRKDGALIHISLTVSPLKDISGEVIGVSRIARDITSRKALEETQSRLAAIIRNSNDAIISKTLDGEITSWNPGAEQIFGYKAEEVIGRNITILFPPDRLDEETYIIDRIKKGEMVEHYESIRVRKDGTPIDISLTISPIKDSNGSIIGVSKIARDVTEQKCREEELRRKNRELEAFTYSVSHDLRAPLRKITQFAEMLADRLPESPDSEVTKYLTKITRHAQHMRDLIDDLLAFSQVSLHDIQKEQVDMDSLFREVIDGLLSQEERTVEVVHQPLPEARGDQALLRQVFENLLSNAVKYSRTQPHTVIEVDGQIENNTATYSIRDNGVGFNMQHASKLFNVFHRLHTQQEFEGTGIGLAIVQQIIAKHGGNVWAESEENKGATFYFSLPLR